MLKRLALLGFAACAVVGCDPCSGVGTCTSGVVSVTAEGQLVRAEDGKGVDGVQIDMVHVSRGGMQSDSLSTRTSGGGFWRLTTLSSVSESTLVRFRISSPVIPQPYTLYRWIVPTARKGEAYLADRWVIDPYFAYIVRILQRGSSAQTLANTPFLFHQTGGPRVIGADANGDIHLTSDGGGYAQFFLFNAFASDTGIIEGELTAQLPAPYGTSTRVVDLYPTATYRTTVHFFDVTLGPNLKYAVVVTSGAKTPVAGVRIDFMRTGGITVEPTSFSIITDANGRAVFPLMPLALGTVTGTVTLTPPTGAASVFPVSIPTFDADSTPVLATWSVSPPTP